MRTFSRQCYHAVGHLLKIVEVILVTDEVVEAVEMILCPAETKIATTMIASDKTANGRRYIMMVQVAKCSSKGQSNDYTLQ